MHRGTRIKSLGTALPPTEKEARTLASCEDYAVIGLPQTPNMPSPEPQFEHYAAKILRLPESPDRADVLDRQFLLGRYDAPPHRSGGKTHRFEVYYAPLHGMRSEAKVVIIGITPGIQQMLAAFREARRLIHEGVEVPRIYYEIRRRMAFAGQTRTNLIQLLEAVGLPQCLGLPSGTDLFGDANSLLHTTSALRYPVFVNGTNYSGHAPKLGERVPAPVRAYLSVLSTQLAAAPNALVIPLGPAVEMALDLIGFDEPRVLGGFPHPSGANRGRHAAFIRDRAPAKRRLVRAWEF